MPLYRYCYIIAVILIIVVCLPAQPTRAAAEYRSVAEVEQWMHERVVQYPSLARLIDIGDSWERTYSGGAGHDLFALRITGTHSSGPKPVLTVIAAMHANEMPTVEIAMRFVDLLLAGYGQDGDITWMLDEHDVVVVPLMNPDGRDLPGPTRKNTRIVDGYACRGIDLNRNFPYAWGGVGASDDPCSINYRGAAPASEPETQAIMALLRELYPGRTAFGDQPVPDTTSGVLLSVHTYGNLVLYPWAQTDEPAPNDQALRQLAIRMAAFNGYAPISAYELYPHSGRLDDWAYAELGVAAFTYEIGVQGHYPPYSEVDTRFWPENRAAMLYALRVTAAPYSLPSGPQLEQIRVTPTNSGLEIQATVVGTSVPGGVNLYLDASPTRNGSALPLQPRDGALDNPREQMYRLLGYEELAAAGSDRKLIYLQANSADGTNGPIHAAWGDPIFQIMLPLL
ncbi:MAG: hypothetical protein HC822_00535 [Oscillochloris sp.]|nr:hypothetical protein [Oscillochloris sp.]